MAAHLLNGTDIARQLRAELGPRVTAFSEQADVVGFYILGIGLVLFIVGKVLTKSTGESVRTAA